MKKILLLIMIASLSLFANELKTQKSFNKAVQKAKEENKAVMLMMSLDSCPVCDYMKDIVFEREQVLAYLNENYVVVIKDIDKDKYPSKFSTINAPTFFFIDPHTQKEIRERKIGGAQPFKFMQDINITKIEAEQNAIVSQKLHTNTL